MFVINTLVLLMSALLVSSQRPSFAGSRPIGYPELVNRTTTPGLVDKFGEGTTERLPVQALGDKDLIDRLSKLPVDKQPFWFINWQAIEASKPQTYPQKPNPFLESDRQSINTGNANPNSATGGSTNTKIQSGLKTSEANNRFSNDNVTPDASNTNTADKKIEPVSTDAVNDQSKPQVDRELGDPLNKGNVATSNSDKKNSEKKVTQVEKDDQFEDIEVKKYVKFLKV